MTQEKKYLETPLEGGMMDVPLLLNGIVARAARNFGDTEIVSRRVEGDTHRYTYAECESRARCLAAALSRLGLSPGDRIGTLAWNGYRHLEIYYGVSGSALVCHTINPRLFPDQIAFIINHADDRYVCFDATFANLVNTLAPRCPRVRGWIAMTDSGAAPIGSGNASILCYEELLAQEDGPYEWPAFDERAAAALCYTSGTTGDPKGVLYSHRSMVLHAFASSLPSALNLSPADTVLPIVPMFHVNAWGLPYAALLVGAKLVLPGPRLDGPSLLDLFEREKVTFSAGIPTVWGGILQHLATTGGPLPCVKRAIVGGAAPSAAMIDALEARGVDVLHGWGMTETSAAATASKLLPKHADLSAVEKRQVIEKQGRAIAGVEVKIVDPGGTELPWNGAASGELLVRGPTIIARYFGNDASPLRDGWFPTGDIATIDRDGSVQIKDRCKDVIKSGGEWISSIAIENIAVGHPDIAAAACIAAFHPKWGERPLLVVVPRAGATVTKPDLIAFFETRVARWWIPDDVVFVDEIPLTAIGKLDKVKLRNQFQSHVAPDA